MSQFADREIVDVVVIGGGQAGLAVGYYLRRTDLRFEILDAEREPGGAWLHTWETLRLFSPAQWSSLPGRLMAGGTDHYPDRREVLAYLRDYERYYALPVRRPVIVRAVRDAGDALAVETDGGVVRARAVVSATGTWGEPYVPDYPGRADFRGEQLHSAAYRSPLAIQGERVLVVGGGNSGAQILAEVSQFAETTWVTLAPPSFLPDGIDGRYLFEEETRRYLAQQRGAARLPSATLGDVVMVEPVREARERGVLVSHPPFERFTEGGVRWSDGRQTAVDTVIWCTGFKPALGHLSPLGVRDAGGRVLVEGTRSVRQPRLWLVGYGHWTGYASATLIGVGRTARATAEEIARELGSGG